MLNVFHTKCYLTTYQGRAMTIISSDFTCKSRKGSCVLQSAGQFDLLPNHINFVFYQVYSRVKVVQQLNPRKSNVRGISQPTKYSV